MEVEAEVPEGEAGEGGEGDWVEGTEHVEEHMEEHVEEHVEEHIEEHVEEHVEHGEEHQEVEEVHLEEHQVAGEDGEVEAGEIEADGNAWWAEGEAGEGEAAGEAATAEADAHDTGAAEAMEEEAPNPDDPMAPVRMDVGWEAAAWLQEEDGRRLRKLERLSGGEAEVSEEGKLKLAPLSHQAPPGGGGTGHSWCDLCARLLCALRTGEEVELTPSILELAEAGDQEGLGLCILEVPGSVEKKAIAGKDGAKLLDMCDTSDVLAVFTWAKEGDTEPLSIKVGDILEGKYGESYFEVEVLDVPEGGDVKVKWAFDGSESELPVSDLQKKAGAESPIKVGDQVEAKYGDKWYDAEVLSCDDKIKVKWGFDSSEAELDAADVKAKATAAEVVEEVVEVNVADLKEGDKVEAKYGDSFHDAEAGSCGNSRNIYSIRYYRTM